MLVRAASSTPSSGRRFERDHELDFALQRRRASSRFRVNLYRQRDSCGAAFRAIPHEIKPLDELGHAASRSTRFAHLPRGLVLVTGPTGSGKTTTLAALLDLANRTRPAHIMTIEDPIEFLHQHKRCLVNQREVGADTADFADGAQARAAPGPRHHPGRRAARPGDHSIALTAAETGHLVLATLHTQSAAQTIDRRHRHLPAAPAAADPRPAVDRAAGRGHPGAGAARRRQGPDGRSARSWSPRRPSGT